MAKADCPKCRLKMPANATRCAKCLYDLNPEEIRANRSKHYVSEIIRLIIMGGAVLLVVRCLASPPATEEQRQRALDITMGGGSVEQHRTVDLSSENIKADIKRFCADRWREDAPMREACTRNATVGASDFINRWNASLDRDDVHNSLILCHFRYTDSRDVTDFSMSGACARNKTEGELGN